MMKTIKDNMICKNDFARKWEIIKIKADLLCMGVCPNEAAEAIHCNQNPCQDWKTGNVGIHISLEGGSHVLVTLSHSFDQRSPYSIDNKEGNLVLLKEKKVVSHVKEVLMPNWYSKKTSTIISMPTFFLHEGRAFLHQAYSGCDYHSMDLQCRFCGASSNWRMGTPLEIGETVAEAVGENSEYHICLGGGTRLPLNRNVEYFAECLGEILKKGSNVPVWIEMIPPDSDKDIARLVELGATSFGFNIEIWDDTLRKEICPGKSRISKNRYFAAMEKALNILHPNHVGSVLMVGLEPIENSINGAVALASIGVQPGMLPFKPWDKSLYRDYPLCNPDNLIEVSRAAVKTMIKNSINPQKNEGCLLCEGCSIDHDVYNIIQEEKGGCNHEDSSS